MTRLTMIAVVLCGLMVASAADAKADHRSGAAGKSRFAVSVSHKNGFKNSGTSYGRGYQSQSNSFPVTSGGYYGGGNGGYGGGYYGGYGGYGGGIYGGGIYGGGYGNGIYYPIFSVPIYVDGFNIGHQSGFGSHRHCR